MKTLNINNWKRKEHFEFFTQFDEPFFGIIAEINVTKAYQKCKDEAYSFFAYYLHKSLLAVNSIEEFKYRIDNDNNVVICDKVHAATTIGRDDETFAFSFVEFDEDFRIFTQRLKTAIKEVQKSSGLGLSESAQRMDAIHYSSTPWLNFTGLTHARNYKTKDSNPLIVFGKAFTNDNIKKMSVSVNVHHGLMDAIHVAKYFELFQEFMDA